MALRRVVRPLHCAHTRVSAAASHHSTLCGMRAGGRTPVCETTTQSRFGAPRPPGKFPRGLAPRDLSGPLQWDPPVVSKS